MVMLLDDNTVNELSFKAKELEVNWQVEFLLKNIF